LFIDVAEGTKNLTTINITKKHIVEHAHIGDNEVAIVANMSGEG